MVESEQRDCCETYLVPSCLSPVRHAPNSLAPRPCNDSSLAQPVRHTTRVDPAGKKKGKKRGKANKTRDVHVLTSGWLQPIWKHCQIGSSPKVRVKMYFKRHTTNTYDNIWEFEGINDCFLGVKNKRYTLGWAKKLLLTTSLVGSWGLVASKSGTIF